MRLYKRGNCVIVVHDRLFEKFEELWIEVAILKYSLLQAHLAYNLDEGFLSGRAEKKKVVVIRLWRCS